MGLNDTNAKYMACLCYWGCLAPCLQRTQTQLPLSCCGREKRDSSLYLYMYMCMWCICICIVYGVPPPLVPNAPLSATSSMLQCQSRSSSKAPWPIAIRQKSVNYTPSCHSHNKSRIISVFRSGAEIKWPYQVAVFPAREWLFSWLSWRSSNCKESLPAGCDSIIISASVYHGGTTEEGTFFRCPTVISYDRTQNTLFTEHSQGVHRAKKWHVHSFIELQSVAKEHDWPTALNHVCSLRYPVLPVLPSLPIRRTLYM